MRDTSCVSIRGAVFCRADASISSSPNLSKCSPNARRKRLIHSLLQMSAYSPAAIATPKIRFCIHSTGTSPRESDRRLHQFLPTLPSVWDRGEIVPTFQGSTLAFVRKHRARGMSHPGRQNGSRKFHRVRLTPSRAQPMGPALCLTDRSRRRISRMPNLQPGTHEQPQESRDRQSQYSHPAATEQARGPSVQDSSL